MARDRNMTDAQKAHHTSIDAAHSEAVEALEHKRVRAHAMAGPVQVVTDGNEAAALASISGSKPERVVPDDIVHAELGPAKGGNAHTAEELASLQGDSN